MIRLLAVCCALLTVIGCNGLTPAPGPVPLRDAQHMADYLTDGTWQLVDHAPDIRWHFKSDGFRFWAVEGGSRQLNDVVPELPGGLASIEGDWSVTETTLTLTDLTDQMGAAVPDITIPLDWVDGKLSINIGANQYRRVLGNR